MAVGHCTNAFTRSNRRIITDQIGGHDNGRRSKREDVMKGKDFLTTNGQRRTDSCTGESSSGIILVSMAYHIIEKKVFLLHSFQNLLLFHDAGDVVYLQILQMLPPKSILLDKKTTVSETREKKSQSLYLGACNSSIVPTPPPGRTFYANPGYQRKTPPPMPSSLSLTMHVFSTHTATQTRHAKTSSNRLEDKFFSF